MSFQLDTELIFDTPKAFPVGGLTLRTGAGDFNKDGNVDLVVIQASRPDPAIRPDPRSPNLVPTISLLLGNGDGSFATPISFSDSVLPDNRFEFTRIVVGDFDGDKNLDFATEILQSFLIGVGSILNPIVFFGNGAGGFQGQRFSRINTLGLVPKAFDFNNDGRQDILAGPTDKPQILLGQSDRTFQVNLAPMLENARGLVTDDFNGDGWLDLATGNITEGKILIALGRGDGTFESPNSFNFPSEPVWLSTSGDFNGDGFIDLIGTSFLSETRPHKMLTFFGNGNGTFRLSDFRPRWGVFAWVVGDINSDKISDFAQPAYDSVSIVLGREDGIFDLDGFSTKVDGQTYKPPTIWQHQDLLLVDLNNDNRLDIVSGIEDRREIVVLLNQTPPKAWFTGVDKPRTTSVEAIKINFSQAVRNFDLSDLTLTLNGNPISLSGATLTTQDSTVFTLGNLGAVTNERGDYKLTLSANDIEFLVGLTLAEGAVTEWKTGRTATALSWIDFTGNPGVRLVGDCQSNLITGTTGNDTILGFRNNDELWGNAGSDQLEGGLGQDTVYGNRGRDRLRGDQGSDRLFGGKGDDILNGGLGNDLLNGGKSRDMFRFTSINSGNDTITDFEIGSDLLDLREIFRDSAFAGVNSFDQFLKFISLEAAEDNTVVKLAVSGGGTELEWRAIATLLNITPTTLTSESFVLN